jgi:hypothetical protein
MLWSRGHWLDGRGGDSAKFGCLGDWIVEGLELEATRRGRRGDSVKSGCLGWVSGSAVCEEENRRV